MDEDAMNAGENAGELPGETVSVLLRVGLVGERSLVERLVEVVSGAGGRAWFAEAILAMGGDVAALGRGERLSLETLERLKNDGKRVVSEARDELGALRGTLTYLVAVGEALAMHRRLIGSRGREELEDVMLDLAEFAPGAWGRMFGAAGDQLAALD